MASDKQIAALPPLRRPSHAVSERGSVRIGDTGISAEFPLRRRPDPKTADPGKVRLGDTGISANFPLRN
jgi:hypothetical protein